MKCGKAILLASLVLGFHLSTALPILDHASDSHVAYAATTDWHEFGDYEIQGDQDGYQQGMHVVEFIKGGTYTIRMKPGVTTSSTQGIVINTTEAVNLTLDNVKTDVGMKVSAGTGQILNFIGNCATTGQITDAGLSTMPGASAIITGSGTLAIAAVGDASAVPVGLNGNFTINRAADSSMQITSTVTGMSGNITLNSGQMKVTAPSGGYTGDLAEPNQLQVNGGKLTLNGQLGMGILGQQAKTSFELNGGQVICEGSVYGIYSLDPESAVVNGGTLTVTDDAPEQAGGAIKTSLTINGGSVKLDPTHYDTIAPANHSFGTLDATNISLPTKVQLPGQSAFTLTDNHPDDHNFYFYLENGADRIATIGEGDAAQNYLFKWDAVNQKFEPGVLLAPQFETTDLPSGVIGEPYNETVVAKSDVYLYEVTGNLPKGMGFDEKQGRFLGTPTEAGTFPITIKAINNNGSTTKNFTLQIKDKYTVTFDPAGGGRIFSETVIEGDSLKKPADPKRADYTFLGWFPSSDLNHSYDFTKPVTENMTLQAGWRHNEAPVEHETVTFDVNGGSSITPLTVRKGEQLQKPTDPTKKGYTFDGWYTDAALTKAYDFNQPIETNFTLYAKWKSETPEDVGQEPLYRLYNPNSGEHFYTKSAQERDWLISLSWKDEGTAWTTPKKGTPVYRVYNPNSGEHFYTKDVPERDDVVKAGWRDEGIGFYSDETNKAVPIYRVFNPNAKDSSSHLFTKSQAEAKWLEGQGWLDEGIAFYGVEPAGAE
ncbi:InlB B-repeat-containing protein [Enterococcus sp. CSURQ0835]|uniref:InlB B-repeat-containing protein n=1 Tax=Enterococcus sp. CSURQ0835 TaxID=2681394 RepID=UPI001356B1E5|nr:InlB B-repeat-containing protein [Enterococcus sp. CSURQ0835]